MTPCIEHQQKAPRYGLGMYKGKKTNLHRVVLMKHTGLDHDTAAGLVARHKCDNARCINPDHLEWGTHSDNMKDRADRSRTAKHEQHGRARLNIEQVRAIRLALAAGSSLRNLAAEYAVGKDTIRKINKLETWVDSSGEPL